MIIVEGPDGAGKSTLIENLKHMKTAHLRALRGGVGESVGGGWANPEHDALDAYTHQILQARGRERAAGTPQAFDRFHISERVYGPLLRSRQDVTLPDLRHISKMLVTQDVPVILCIPSFVQCMKNVRADGRERPEYQTDKFLWEAYHGFFEVWNEITLTEKQWGVKLVHHYDYTKDPTAAALISANFIPR